MKYTVNYDSENSKYIAQLEITSDAILTSGSLEKMSDEIQRKLTEHITNKAIDLYTQEVLSKINVDAIVNLAVAKMASRTADLLGDKK